MRDFESVSETCFRATLAALVLQRKTMFREPWGWGRWPEVLLGSASPSLWAALWEGARWQEKNSETEKEMKKRWVSLSFFFKKKVIQHNSTDSVGFDGAFTCWGCAVVGFWPWGERAGEREALDDLTVSAWFIFASTTSEISERSSAWWSPISCIDEPTTWTERAQTMY